MPSDSSSAAGPVRLRLRLAQLGFALAALGAAYLTAVTLGLAPALGCGSGPQCDTLFSGRWSRWLGLPVALWGLVVYGGALLSAFAVLRARSPEPQQSAWRAAVSFGASAVAGALWFLIVPLAFASGWCALCIVTVVIGGAAGALLVSFARLAPSTRPNRGASPGLVGAAGAVGLLALWLGQAALAPAKQPPAQPEKPVAKAPPTTPLPTASAADAGPPEPPARLIGLHLGRVVLNGNDHPFWGQPGARYSATVVIDYTDQNTRKMRPIFEQAIAKYKGALAMLLLAAPLDSSCNRYVKATLPANENACRYAELAFAVWRAKRDAFRQFDNFMYAKQAPPSLEKAKARAEALVGKEELARALQNPWVATQIQNGIEVLQANHEKGIELILPQMMLGPFVARGMSDLETLTDVLDEFTQTTPPGSSKVLGPL